MRSYAPALELGSVVDDYSSRAHNRISDLLSKLKERAASYLSKFWYHVNIVGRLDEYEQSIQAMIDSDNAQIHALKANLSTLKVGLNTISESLTACEGHVSTLREIDGALEEIANSPNRVEQLKKKKLVLEHLLNTLPKE